MRVYKRNKNFYFFFFVMVVATNKEIFLILCELKLRNKFINILFKFKYTLIRHLLIPNNNKKIIK